VKALTHALLTAPALAGALWPPVMPRWGQLMKPVEALVPAIHRSGNVTALLATQAMLAQSVSLGLCPEVRCVY
jgi:hypothetical protein